MRKADIDALVRAHGGRTRPVLHLHVLRQAHLEPDDHAFLKHHIDELSAIDLLRWKARCDEGFSIDVIRRLAGLAERDPREFANDILEAPRLSLAPEEWRELADLVHGKVPDELHARIATSMRGELPPRAERTSSLEPPPASSRDARAMDAVLPQDEARDDELIARTTDPSALTLRQILRSRTLGRPIVDERALIGIAMSRAKSSDEDWSDSVRELPAGLMDAVVEKSRSTKRDAERTNLLGWMQAHGVPRAEVVRIAIDAIRGEGQVSALLSWLSAELATRTAWEKHGTELFSALIARRGFSEMADVITASFAQACRDHADVPRGFVESIQSAFALALVDAARAALTSDHTGRAAAALSALACLDPPSRLSKAVHGLALLPNATGEVADLIAVNERLIKHHTSADSGSFETLVAAIHALADAWV